jgi:hypothetical protein
VRFDKNTCHAPFEIGAGLLEGRGGVGLMFARL